MAFRRLLFAALLAVLQVWPGPASADPILGTWQVEPDHKGQVGQIAIRRCGEAFCGRVMKVHDRNGKSVVTKAMGRDLFWGLRAFGGGNYGGGMVWVPLFDREYNARARLSGDRLRVLGCVGKICDGQMWQRLR